MQQNKDSIILGIESSCDDTSAAVIKNGILLSNVTANQAIHEQYGGVVPELASRAHQENIIPVVDAALKEANLKTQDLTAIAFTKGPGLLGSLLVGTSFAKSLALALNISLLDVHHMKAHIHAHFIEKSNLKKQTPKFPFLCLTVSGGHTQIVYVKAPLNMTVIATTIDDAVGEAFDKAGKSMGLKYPSGPIIDQLAQNGDANKYEFTFPKAGENNYSFSGLKTQFLNFLNKEQQKNKLFIEQEINHICASYQAHLIEYLMINLRKVIKEHPCKDIALAGGVAANSELRRQINQLGEKLNYNTHIPEIEFCTDNAAMIAISGYFMEKEKLFADLSVSAKARIPMNLK
jgi:N6-L-threonylcarbamoyladenine synthase